MTLNGKELKTALWPWKKLIAIPNINPNSRIYFIVLLIVRRSYSTESTAGLFCTHLSTLVKVLYPASRPFFTGLMRDFGQWPSSLEFLLMLGRIFFFSFFHPNNEFHKLGLAKRPVPVIEER